MARPKPGSPISGDFLHTPMGVATDSAGNAWIANQGVAAPNCPNFGLDVGVPSLALHARRDARPRRALHRRGPRSRGASPSTATTTSGSRTSQGSESPSSAGFPRPDCVPGSGPGHPISPDVTGYGFDGLTRNTGVAIDPSGNVWLTNNWMQDPLVPNPGGHELVAFVGMAGPVQPSAPRPRPAPAPARVLITPKFTG